MSVDEDQRLRDLQRNYLDFLDDSGKYSDLVRDLIDSNSTRLIVNINDLRRKFPERAMCVVSDSVCESLALTRALKEFVASLDSDYAKEKSDFYVGFEGSFGPYHLTPRSLTAMHLNYMVCLEGIATKCSLVKPKINRSVHYCPNTQKTTERTYTDLTSLDPFPSSAAYPTQDEDGNPLQTEFGLSTYKNHQTLTIQELPEKAPTGQLPRSVDVICDHDLVDVCKPGDRVQIVGSYRCLPGKQGGYSSGTFKSVLLANNVLLQAVQNGPEITGADVEQCKKFAKKHRNSFDILAKSLAPSIHGHEFVKKALLCQLLGGVEKHLPNGSRLRGDINLLLIGDPSVAKSQMLRYVLATSTRAVPTTGRGSSGVGLTAAVSTDQESGERRLEAGAMVLADRGIVCIDEFDKMSDMDRTAIHEVMEQGRVTISKAGIHASLNARCSVLAAANPVYGRYDPFKTPMENIGLQDSLLSRFDLLFVLLDICDVDTDKKIADHVVRTHRYRNPQEVDGAVSTNLTGFKELGTLANRANNADEDTHDPKDIWDKHDKMLNPKTASSDRLLNLKFVKKYIEVAKHMKPVLTEAACELIGEEYSRLRATPGDSKEQARTQPITARSLETMIRLSTAHAKSRLSKTIEKKDADVAIQLVQYAYFKTILEREKKRGHDSDSESEEEEEVAMEQEEVASSQPKAAAPKAKKPREDSGPAIDVSELLPKFMKSLDAMYYETRVDKLVFPDVVERMSAELGADEATVRACVKRMEDDNKVMLADGVDLYRI